MLPYYYLNDIDPLFFEKAAENMEGLDQEPVWFEDDQNLNSSLRCFENGTVQVPFGAEYAIGVIQQNISIANGSEVSDYYVLQVFLVCLPRVYYIQYVSA